MITGNASTIRMFVMKVIHVNKGRRIKDIPGARMLIIVTRKLKDAARDAMPSTCKLTIQKSIPVPGFCCTLVSGA